MSKTLKEDFLTAHIPVIILIDRKQIRKRMLEIEQGVDDYIANPPDPIDLEVRLEMALRRTMHQLHANALTKLPGNREIEKVIQSRIEGGGNFSVAYYDIDNFKSFNDKYGYMKGDSVIRHTAYIVSTTVKSYGNKSDFVGHIGGDDFVVVTTPEHDRLIASESILRFNRIAPFHYSPQDRETRYIVVKDRKGRMSNTPLMTISIAIVNNTDRKLQSIVELMEIIAEIKRYLKTLSGSNFLVNRRSVTKKESIPPGSKVFSKPRRGKGDSFKYRPLGQILIELGIIDTAQLERALNKHWSTGEKIGQSVIGLGMASSGDITRALEMQLNIPHYEPRVLDKNGELKTLLEKVPVELMKDAAIIPVNKEKGIVSVVMLNPRDVDAINKIKNFTGCSIAPFFVLENEFNEIWKEVVKKSR